MNKNESIILQQLAQFPALTQRQLASFTDFSLGKVNKTLKELKEDGWLVDNKKLSSKAQRIIKAHHPKRAIILAAGYGMRMVPINMERPKALLEVHHQILIERIIQQLHDVNITDITVVVGFMKEHFEYLIDKEGVQLITNPNYATHNNLWSLTQAIEKIDQCYIIPGDIWFKANPFQTVEFDSWYLLSKKEETHQPWKVSKQRKIELANANHPLGNRAIGLAYINHTVSPLLKDNLQRLSASPQYNQSFWEEAVDHNIRNLMIARLMDEANYSEINTYEDLLDTDEYSDHLNNNAINIITHTLKIQRKDIKKITVLKKGMTNRSFMFYAHNKRYIMRIPGAGTAKLINRQHEAAVYQVLSKYCIAEPVKYLNPKNGYKLTQFIPNSHNCDPHNPAEVKKCMAFLRSFHQLKLKVEHSFPLFDQINFYEKLRHGRPSAYQDYKIVKDRVFALKPYINKYMAKRCLTHIDANPDNFLIINQSDGTEQIRLIDWEYAGMQDPHLDIAMFASYSMYNRQEVDHLIDLYFNHQCSQQTRIKIYCYLASAGLLWSNWCEYKQSMGIDFGEYSLAQFRFAKEYSALAENLIKGE